MTRRLFGLLDSENEGSTKSTTSISWEVMATEA